MKIKGYTEFDNIEYELGQVFIDASTQELENLKLFIDHITLSINNKGNNLTEINIKSFHDYLKARNLSTNELDIIIQLINNEDD